MVDFIMKCEDADTNGAATKDEVSKSIQYEDAAFTKTMVLIELYAKLNDPLKNTLSLSLNLYKQERREYPRVTTYEHRDSSYRPYIV